MGCMQVVGTILCVGIVFAQGAAAVFLLPQPEGSYNEPPDDPWYYCAEHQFERPACDNGAPVFQEKPEGTSWCYTGIAREVAYKTGGASLVDVERVFCLLTSDITLEVGA